MKNRRRILMMAAGIIVVVALALFIFWQTNGSRVVAAINDAILIRAGQSLNGHLAAERMDFSIFGTTSVHKLVVYDSRNNEVAACDKMVLDFGLADLMRGYFALEKIKNVTVEGVRLNLIHDPKGHWNVAGLLKPSSGEEPRLFRGELKVIGGAASVSGPKGNKQLEQVEGTLDFASYPVIKTDLKGRLGASSIAAEGRWSAAGAMKLNLQADRLEIPQILDYFPSVEKTEFQDGRVYDLTVTLHREKGPVEMTAKGVVSGLSADFSGVKLTDMKGIVKFSDNVLEIQDATLLYGGQKLAARGKIDFKSSQPRLDLAVNGTAFELAALSSNSPVFGAATFQSVVKGSPEQLEISGNFSIPSGKFYSTAYTDTTGLFTYAKNTLTLDSVTLNCLGGKISLSGIWDHKNAVLQQEITGINLDAALLSGGAISGAVDLRVRVTGSEAASAKVQGSFVMPAATINGAVIERMSGDFIKIGQSLELANLDFSAAGQKVTAAGRILLDGEVPELDMSVSSDGIDISTIKPDLPINGIVAVQAAVTGTMKNYSVAGSLQIPSGQIGTLPFVDADGEFSFAANVLELRSLQFSLFGDSVTKQDITATGKIILGGEDPALDLRVSSDGIDVSAIKPEIPIGGLLAFQALVTGSAKEYKVTGTFQLPSGRIGALPITDGNGEFLFAADVLNLQSVRVSALGGSIKSEGTVAKTGAYYQQVSGQNLDAAILTNGDVRGKASFTASVHGEDRWAKASAEGKITMASGMMKNTAFTSLSLDFRQHGTKFDITALDIKFLRGLVRGTGYTQGDYLMMKLAPAKNRRSRFLGISTFVLFGSNPLAAILGQAASELLPFGVMKIRINGLGGP